VKASGRIAFLVSAAVSRVVVAARCGARPRELGEDHQKISPTGTSREPDTRTLGAFSGFFQRRQT
jgi:hypothetical protein